MGDVTRFRSSSGCCLDHDLAKVSALSEVGSISMPAERSPPLDQHRARPAAGEPPKTVSRGPRPPPTPALPGAAMASALDRPCHFLATIISLRRISNRLF